MRRTIKKRKLMLDRMLFITTKETLFDTESDKVTDLIRVGMAITDATLDRLKRDERKVVTMKKELDHMQNQAE
jgi:oligoribonuclease (3'-5' exoribonuclease)